jgi:hypothetical protein
LADRAPRSWFEPSAANAYRMVLIGGFLLMLAANLPGHLSLDSVVALHEGRTGVRETWAPAVVSWILGRFDEVLSGTGLYVAASGALLYGSLLALRGLRPRTSWAAPATALAAVLTPGLLIYQAIVWKDVLFANLATAGFVLLAHAARHWPEPTRMAPLALAALCFALAALVRQNGAVTAVAAALALAWISRGGGWRASLGWGLGGLVAVALLAAGINVAVQPERVAPKLRSNAGLLVLQHYDIVGAAAHDPALTFDVLAKTNPAAAALLRRKAAATYSAERVDTLDVDPAFRRALWRNPDPVMAAQWREVITRHTGDYLAHRSAAFVQVFATPKLDRCLPVHVGVTGPPALLEDLDIAGVVEPQDQALGAYAARFFGTPLYSHLTYAAIAALAAAALLWRRKPADVAMAAMLLSALAFTATFFVISVACDYRYLYFLDMAAISGLIYLALDPSLRRRSGEGGHPNLTRGLP